MKKKGRISILILLGLVVGLVGESTSCSPAGTSRIWTDRTSYCIGDPIRIHFIVFEDGCPNLDCGVWIYDYGTDGSVSTLWKGGVQCDKTYTFTGRVMGPPGTERLKLYIQCYPIISGFEYWTQFEIRDCGNTSPEEVCDNGKDDDKDGKTDCNDSDCSRSSCCKDSDGDGVKDCDDKCPYERGSASNNGCPIEICDNGKDDDKDGKTDCNDSDCSRSSCCKDSDGDGVKDCDDKCPYERGSASNNGCPAGALRVIVDDDSGKKIQGVEIYLDGKLEGKTNSRGELTIENIEPGTHTVRASKAGFEDAREEVSIGGGREETVHLVLNRVRATINVIVKDESGKNVKDAKIYVDGAYEGKTNSNGVFIAKDIEPGTHTVRASKAGFEDAREEVSIGGGREETVHLVLHEIVSEEEEAEKEIRVRVSGNVYVVKFFEDGTKKVYRGNGDPETHKDTIEKAVFTANFVISIRDGPGLGFWEAYFSDEEEELEKEMKEAIRLRDGIKKAKDEHIWKDIGGDILMSVISALSGESVEPLLLFVVERAFGKEAEKALQVILGDWKGIIVDGAVDLLSGEVDDIREEILMQFEVATKASAEMVDSIEKLEGKFKIMDEKYSRIESGIEGSEIISYEQVDELFSVTRDYLDYYISYFNKKEEFLFETQQLLILSIKQHGARASIFAMINLCDDSYVPKESEFAARTLCYLRNSLSALASIAEADAEKAIVDCAEIYEEYDVYLKSIRSIQNTEKRALRKLDEYRRKLEK
jgi:hypothetical protein